MKNKCSIAIAILLFLLSLNIYAQENLEAAPESSVEENQSENKTYEEEKLLVKQLYHKRPLKEKILNKKKPGFNPTGIVAPFANPDVGIGVIGVTGLFFNGDKKDPLFSYRPYNQRVIIGAFATTKGLAGFGLNFDAPYLNSSLLRYRSMSEYIRNINYNYFGNGTETLKNLGTGSSQAFQKINDFNNFAKQIAADGTNNTKYYKALVERISHISTLEKDFFGGLVRLQTGFQVEKFNVFDYTRKTTDITNNDGSVSSSTNNITKLREDHLAGKVLGYHGGWNNGLLVGLAIDTRDFEPNPESGFFIDFTTSVYHKAMGSEFSYQRYTFVQRYYLKPVNALPFVFAGRWLNVVSQGDVPFYTMNRALQTDRQLTSVMGGRLSGRGFLKNRFMAPIVSIGTLEIRTTIARFTLLKQHFSIMLAPFVDIGTIYDSFQSITVKNTKAKIGYGAGARFSWNLSTIVLADYGFSEEGTGFYFYVEHTY